MPETLETTNQPTTQSAPGKQLFNFLVYLSLIILIIIIGGAGYYFYQKQQLLPMPESEAQELARVVKQVGKLMDLPDDETPVLATVTDKDKINTQSFFAKSENGDKVLLYTTFGRAILYRPSTNKIVDVTLINTTTSSNVTPSAPVVEATSPPKSEVTTPSPSPATSDYVKVTILNGTTTVGLANNVETMLLSAIPNIEISTKANATRQDYPTTQVIALSPSAEEVATQIAQIYNVSVSPQLPDGELATEVDVVVILGADAL